MSRTQRSMSSAIQAMLCRFVCDCADHDALQNRDRTNLGAATSKRRAVPDQRCTTTRQSDQRSLRERVRRVAPLAWIGTVSYSLYIWQQLFMSFQSPWAMCVFLPVVALLSYYLIERPATQWGHRLTSSHDHNTNRLKPGVAFAEAAN